MNEKQDLLEKGTQYSRIELKTVQIKKAVVLCSGLFEQNSETHFKKNSAISIKEPTNCSNFTNFKIREIKQNRVADFVVIYTFSPLKLVLILPQKNVQQKIVSACFKEILII